MPVDAVHALSGRAVNTNIDDLDYFPTRTIYGEICDA